MSIRYGQLVFPSSLRLVWLLFGWLLAGCESPKPPTDVEVATAWADMALHVTKNTPANSPTYASRCFGYMGLTMYESVVPGFAAYQSLGGQLNGLADLPKPETGQTYHWPAALNAGQAYMLKQLYNQTGNPNKQRIDSLAQTFHERFAKSSVDEAQLRRSAAFGRAVAAHIFAWSKTDGGHRGYLKNFDKTMKLPSHLGCWKPPLYAQSFSHFPLHPHWGKNRPFLAADARIDPPAFIPYDTSKTSAYYRQYLEVYEKDKILTQKEKECAVWWGDDPDETFTPPGHSYYLATLAIRKKRPSLIRCAETYARVGLAVADAFINCWKWKYQFFSERPNTYIPEHIDPQWNSFWPEPPFPAFPSGHAIQAAAAATVLTDLYGERFSLTDSAHAGRPRDRLREVEFRPRSFDSFWQVAQETADSRFYGGIHTRQDNEAGLEKGREIGRHINGLAWRRPSVKPRNALSQR